MIAIYCAYLWRVENFHHNRNALMTAPVPISWIFLGKFISAFSVAVLTQLWVGVPVYRHRQSRRASRSASPDYPLLADPGTFRSSCGNRPAVSSFYGDPQLCPSHRPGCHRKHCGTAGLQHRLSLLLSLLFDDCGMNANRSEDMLGGLAVSFTASALLYTLIFLTLSILILKRTDVKA